MKQVRLLLLRHGECEGGAILRGRVDVPLNQKGWQQMSAAVEAQATACQGIYSSTARRCAEFAAAFATELHSTAALASKPLQTQFIAELQEIDFGDWDGRRLDDLHHHEGERLAAYWQNPWQAPPPNGEAMASFESRVDAAIDRILAVEFARLSDKDRANKETANADVDVGLDESAKIWVVTHGGVIRHLMARALGASQTVGFYSQLSLPVAAVVRINVLQDEQGVHYWRLDWPTAGCA